jgi:hypothetical protein
MCEDRQELDTGRVADGYPGESGKIGRLTIDRAEPLLWNVARILGDLMPFRKIGWVAIFR